MNNYKSILIVSHRRSGTHLTIDSIINNFEGVDKNYFNLDVIFPTHKEHKNLLESEQLRNGTRIHLLKSHMRHDRSTILGNYNSLPEEERLFCNNLISQSKIIYVIRDGRDLMVSSYYYIKSFKDYNLSFYEHLRENLDQWKEHVLGWIDDPSILIVKYEDYANDYLMALRKIADYTGLKLKKNIKNIYGNINIPHSFIKRKIRKLAIRLSLAPKITAVVPRKGITGDWKNHFDDKSKEFFKKNAGDLLIRLGYEEDYNW